MKKTKRLLFAICLLIVSATLLGTASYAWFSMNTEVNVDGIRVEAYSDSIFLEISKTTADDSFTTNVDFSSTGEVILRLAKHGFVGDNAVSIAATKVDDDTFYDGTNDGTYYKFIRDSVDSYQKYVKAVFGVDYFNGTLLSGLYKDLVFTATAANAKAVAGTTYYEVVAGKYTPVTVAAGAPVTGYYVLTTADPTPLGTVYYNGTGTYFAKTDDAYANVTATLEKGTDLSQFYTLAATNLDETAVTGDVYLAQTGEAADEYAYLGKYDTATDISEALYFGRAYSDVIASGDQGDTLNILKDLTAADRTYFYKETVYLRNALNTNNSKNLEATITVGGAENTMAKALRVLLVVTNAAGERVTTAYYDNNVDTRTFDIIDMLAGNKQETLKVEIYVYFDGTDVVAENADITAGVLDGQTVSIAFNVDDHAYNEAPVVTP